jgi:hypothetical protein
VTDVASRRIVGFALSGHHDAQLAYGALAMAVAVRGVISQPTSYAHLAVDSTVPEVATLATMTRPTPDDCNSSCRFVVAKALAGAWLVSGCWWSACWLVAFFFGGIGEEVIDHAMQERGELV